MRSSLAKNPCHLTPSHRIVSSVDHPGFSLDWVSVESFTMADELPLCIAEECIPNVYRVLSTPREGEGQCARERGSSCGRKGGRNSGQNGCLWVP